MDTTAQIPLTTPVVEQARAVLTGLPEHAPWVVTTRWGYVTGPALGDDDTAPYPVTVSLYEPVDVTTDAVKALERHAFTARYLAAATVLLPTLVVLLWITYVPGWPVGLAAGGALAWWLRKEAPAKFIRHPFTRCQHVVHDTTASLGGILTALRTDPVIDVLDTTGQSLTTGQEADFLTVWQDVWAATSEQTGETP